MVYQKFELCHQNQYIPAYESEIQQMAGVAIQGRGAEAGGEAYGLSTRAGRPVVMYCTGPGPNAVREAFHFRQDIEFLKEIDRYIEQKYGLQNIGDYHSHLLHLKEPSPGDVKSTNSFSARNNHSQRVQFILTLTKGQPSSIYSYRSCPDEYGDSQKTPGLGAARTWGFNRINCRGRTEWGKSLLRGKIVQINSFIYLNGRPTRCPLKVIKGISPIRQALSKDCPVPNFKRLYHHPMSQIIFDSFEDLSKNHGNISELPAAIEKQYVKLPEFIRDRIKAKIKDNFLILSLPVSNSSIAYVTYNRFSPHRIVAVHLSDCQCREKSISDITSNTRLSGPFTPLTEIYDNIKFLCNDNRDFGKLIHETKGPKEIKTYASSKDGETSYLWTMISGFKNILKRRFKWI